MPSPVTLAKLLLRVRRRANLEGHLDAFPDAEVTDEINVSIADWWDLVRLTTWMGQYQRKAWPITTSNGKSLYDLAPNHGAIISVDANIQGNSYSISAMPYGEEQRNMFRLVPYVGWNFGIQSVWYQQQGNAINFLPSPTGNYQVVVNYTPTAPVLSQASDFLDTVNGWEEWIVLDTAIKLLIKAGMVEAIGPLEARRQEQATRIHHAAANADMNQAEGVHEVAAYSGYGVGGNWL